MAIAHLSVKTGGAGKASAHALYIGREEHYAKHLAQENDLEYVATGNMPAWAAQHTQQFWKAADLYERKNGSTYREYEIALPRELDKAQRIELIEAFVQQEIGDKYPYQLAIHNPKAMDGFEQPHAHLMFNERLQDGIERDPEQYFKRYNRKNPENGGARKDNTGKDPKTRREEIQALRQRWEQITNQHLERAGLSTRIDMRSYQAQGLDKTPERKLLPSQSKDPHIRQAMTELRQSEKVIAQIDLGNIQQQLRLSKTSPSPDQDEWLEQTKPQSTLDEKPQITAEMRDGMSKAREKYQQMKAEKAQQERLKQEQERNLRSGPSMRF